MKSFTFTKSALFAGLIMAILATPSIFAEQFLHDGNSGRDWTHLMPSRTASGDPCVMAYNSTTGGISWNAVTHFGGGFGSPVTSSGLSPLNNEWGLTGLTNFAPLSINGTQYLLALNNKTNESYINRINADCTSSVTVFSGAASQRWTHVSSYYINGAPFIVAYNANYQDGDAFNTYTDSIHPNGAGVTHMWGGFFLDGANQKVRWTSMETFTDQNNNPYVLLYEAKSGRLQINRINANAQGYTIVDEEVLKTQNQLPFTGLTNFVFSPANNQFFAYRVTDGAVYFYTMKGDATGIQSALAWGWVKNVSLFAPFYFRVPIDAGEMASIGGFVTYNGGQQFHNDVQLWLF